MSASSVYVVAGLGNPGSEYQYHRHNVGFMVAEELRRRHGLPTLRTRFKALAGEGTVMGRKVALILPMTFMNLSGRAVGEAVRWYKAPVERVLVVHDEVELPFGEVRIKEGGGLGGHNGLRSIEQVLGSREFWRVRVGVGRPASSSSPLVDHVLEPFTEPREDVLLLIGAGADAVEEWLDSRTED